MFTQKIYSLATFLIETESRFLCAQILGFVTGRAVKMNSLLLIMKSRLDDLVFSGSGARALLGLLSCRGLG